MTKENHPTPTYPLRQILGSLQADGLTDAQLLERFVTRRDETAFEVLVWRHGTMVRAVCRRHLLHEQDAEDAFQATFLVLVRKAHSIGQRQAVAGWLHRVAYRVALRAKRVARKRAERQTQVGDVVGAELVPDVVWGDLRPVLDEELNRLPEKYRVPFVLCYLEGMTNAEAARELGCPKGTVLSRLSWGRQRLRARLTRRGLAPSAGLMGVALAATAAWAGVPRALVAQTLKVAMRVAAGEAVAAAAPGPVAVLTGGVLRTMLRNKIMIVTSCLLAAGVFGSSLVAPMLAPTEARVVAGQPADERAPKAGAPDQQPAQAEPPPPEPKTYTFDLRDKPWASVFEWYSDITGLPFVGQFKPTGTATFVPPNRKQKYTVGEITDFLNELLLAQKYLLVRRDASFTVLSADEKIDPALLPRVRLGDLGKRGRTELVTAVLPLTTLNAKDIAPEVKKLLGQFGEVVVLEKANQLILQDTSGNLRRIHEMIKDLEDRGPGKK